MTNQNDIRRLHSNLQASRGGGDLILGVKSTSEEEILADGDYTTYTYKIAQIPDDGLGHLLDAIRSNVESLMDDIDDGREVQDYDITTVDRDNTPLQYIDVEQIPSFERFAPLFSDSNIDDISTYQENYPYFQSYQIISNPVITGFKIFTKRQVMEAENQYRMYSEEQNEYSKFDHDLITLPNSFDCIYYNGDIIIINPKNFEKIFDYFETYRRHADNVLTTLNDSNINIQNFDSFVQAIQGDRRALRKMKEIEDVGLYADITQSDVEGVVQDYDLSIRTEGEGEDWEIVIPDMRHKWDVIRLLNDDHLRSDLTEGRYQVYGKDKRE